MGNQVPDKEALRRSRKCIVDMLEERARREHDFNKHLDPTEEITHLLLHSLAEKDDATMEQIKKAREKALHRAKSIRAHIPKPFVQDARLRDLTFQDDRVFAPPYKWPFTWSATSGGSGNTNPEGTTTTADVDTGDMVCQFGGLSAHNQASSAEVGLGVFFQPSQTSAVMTVSANPSLSYTYGCHSFSAYTHTHAFIGLQISEFTLSGELVNTVSDHRIQLWDLTHNNDFGGNNSGFALSASVPVDDDHFYEIFVAVGGDAEAGSGSSGPYAYGTLQIHLPYIAVHAS